MKRPPPLATWLLNQAASSPMRESVLGDLIEQYQRGRSRFWFWRQVLMTLLAESWNDIRDHQILALRAAITGFLLYLALSFPVSLVIRAVQTSITRWLVASGHATLWWFFWSTHVTHGFFACSACALVGAIVARLYPSHRVAMVFSSSVALFLFEYGATSYGFLRYGVPPEPLFIVVLPVLFVMGRPLSMLIGGLSVSVRPR